MSHALAASAGAFYGGYLLDLLRTLFALAGVCLLAWVVLRMLARRGIGTGGSSGRMRVVERLALDRKTTLLLVVVDGRELLLAVGDSGPPRLIEVLAEPGSDPPATDTAETPDE